MQTTNNTGEIDLPWFNIARNCQSRCDQFYFSNFQILQIFKIKNLLIKILKIFTQNLLKVFITNYREKC